MKNKILSIAVGVCIVAARFVHADEIEYQKIRAAMSKLAPLVGEWNAVWTFYDKNSVKEDPDPGTESISFVLDGTYLEFQWEHHNKQDPTRVRKVTSFVTFNPRTNQYDSTYFYRWNALRVTDTGEYDPVLQEFRTRGFIPLEDGVNDETVRTFTGLKDPNRIVYKHYSRRSPAETCERMDLEIVFTRVR
jgi:hypothetical protein